MAKRDADAAVITAAPLLTLAVPTFNRLECLRLLVDSLSSQLEQINSQQLRVELLICDNASSDGTAAYLASLSARDDVRIVRHQSNLGADGNMVQCFERAHGRYLWICGDDDLPIPGALALVTECLETEHPALLYLPASWHDGDLSSFLLERPIPGSFFTIDAMEVARMANAYITFISSWIVDRHAYRQGPAPDPGRYVGTSLAQLEWHLALLVSGEKLMTTERRWVVARSGNAGGYALFEVFVTNFTRIVDEKLHARQPLRRFFRGFMLRSYLPGLVWGLRQQAVGDFDRIDHGRLRTELRAAWPRAPLFAAVVSLIGRLPWPLAAVTFTMSWLSARLWLASLGLMDRTRNRR
jgi:glycosyltransferase involved in cell wall biosynthesis